MGSRAAWLRRRTLWLVTAAALLESANENLLPSMYREVGAALGSVTLCRALAQALCCPLAACGAARLDRARVVAAGTFLCAVAAALVGASSTVLDDLQNESLWPPLSPTSSLLLGPWPSWRSRC
ncbi:unnamed protein product [Urochloa humidicola]